MNNSKVVILGAGHVGSHAAYALAQKGICSEIVLVDIDREKAVAQALDVDDSVGFGAGETFVRAGEYGDVSDAAVVINAIGEGRKPGQTRLDLLGRSAEMAEELITSLKPFPIPGIFISITNPWAFSLGEHGDSSMIPFDAVRIGGLGTAEYGLSKEDLLKDTRESGMVIIEGKKSTEFGIGSAAADLVKCILLDEKRIFPVSAFLEGEYGENGVHCGVPCRIGSGGIEKIIELSLSEKEKEQLHHSCEVIREHIRIAGRK